MVMVMMAFVRLAEQVHQRAHDVESRPAYVQPIKARRHLLGGKKVQNQVGANAHQDARDGDELVAIEGARTIEFGEIHGRRLSEKGPDDQDEVQ
jgi:hypothetical protein